MIRPYTVGDAPPLAAIHNRVYPANTYTPASFHEFVDRTLSSTGFSWVLETSSLAGYALLRSVPGLEGIGELLGCIDPAWQRRGLGGQLLRYLLHQLRATDYWQLSHHVTRLDSPAASFLLQNHFFLEHEEWLMELDNLTDLPDLPRAKSVRLHTFSRATAVSIFCRLYEASFSGLPWHQPFTPSEVLATLRHPKDILFLTLDGEPIGFAWITLDEDRKGLIEPLGIIPLYQGCGFGRILLVATLRELAWRGAKRVEIGAWRNNEGAIHLYHSLGFRHRKTFTYLAYNLQEST